LAAPAGLARPRSLSLRPGEPQLGLELELELEL